MGTICQQLQQSDNNVVEWVKTVTSQKLTTSKTWWVNTTTKGKPWTRKCVYVGSDL